MSILRRLHSTELNTRQSAGFGLGRPAPQIVFHGKVQVRLRLLVKLAIQGFPPK